MALKIRLRHDPAATWTSVNPVLASGETGVELDTGRFKVGNGVTAWNALAYTSLQGATQTAPYRSFGDGSDGNVTISSGTTTLAQDMYYNNLTLNGTGKIDCNGYKIFIKGILDLTAAGAGAIHANGATGGAASGATGGAVGTVTVAGTMGSQNPGSAGANGTTGAGATSAGVTAQAGNGGSSNTSGAGGSGVSGAGAAGGGGQPPTSAIIRGYQTNFLRTLALIGGGSGGRGGGSGAGDGVNSGGGGGAGGVGGGTVVIFVNKIITSSSTTARAIQAIGGTGGAGGTATTGDCGGGGGGTGGGGGWIYICYNEKFGPVINLISASGGPGGVGGNGVGTGLGGGGANGGNGGSVNLIKVPAQTGLRFNGVGEAIFIPETFTSTAQGATIAGRNGGVGGVREVSL